MEWPKRIQIYRLLNDDNAFDGKHDVTPCRFQGPIVIKNTTTSWIKAEHSSIMRCYKSKKVTIKS